MSNLAYAPTRPRVAQPAPPLRPARRVEIVPNRALRRARPKPLYAVVAIGGLFALFLGQLLLSIGVSDGAYQIASLQSQKAELDRQQQSLSEQADVLSSTQNLATKAAQLGMVPSGGTPAFLDLADGRVIGTSKAASAATSGVATLANSLLPESDPTTDAATGAVGDAGSAGDTTAGDPAAGEAGTASGEAPAGTASVPAGTTGAGTTGAGTTGAGTTIADESQDALGSTGAPATPTTTPPVLSTDGGLPTPTTH
ncbi:hypothetical protein QT381_08670 [Galbitalea sp. SE-J8]|uniref:hypothetical protein n=1 Tax=Galbitalea sp. SE-J8 TaxID=3054952 RepID=UPI00259C829D|nr:hypothetical protein [Galbitalea sp. SE-J8]MDM4763079.1 hypothetical protein [Galbitalea sp. SE-J8]